MLLRPSVRRPGLNWIILCVFGGPLLSCASRPASCESPRECGAGYECLTLHCVPNNSDPVPPRSRRWVLDAAQVAVAHPTSQAAAEATVGEGRDSAVYLEFEFPKALTKDHGQDLDNAFLLLEQPELAPALTRSAHLVIRNLREPWNSQQVMRGRLPQDTGPQSETTIWHQSTARIDVTELVRHQLNTPAEAHGFQLTGDTGPFTVSLGLGNGRAPRLELYTAIGDER